MNKLVLKTTFPECQIEPTIEEFFTPDREEKSEE